MRNMRAEISGRNKKQLSSHNARTKATKDRKNS